MQVSFGRSRVVVKRKLELRPPDPDIVIYTPEWTGDRPRTGPFLTSLLLHSLIVGTTFLLHYTRPRQTPPEPETAEQLLQDDRYKLTWNYMKDDLPPVEPAEPKPAAPAPKKQTGESRAPRFKLPQEVVANDPNAASDRQMIYDQAPELELVADLKSPNFVEPAMPARPRYESTPEQLISPVRQALTADQAPQIAANSPNALISPEPKLRYWEPERQQADPSRRALTAENAPQVKAAPTPLNPALQSDPKLRYWTPEQDPASPKRQALTADAAPSVRSGPDETLDIGETKLSKLRYWSEENGQATPGKRALGAADAPQIAAAPTEGVNPEMFQRLSRLRYQDTGGDANAPNTPQRQPIGETAPDLRAAASAQRGAADLADSHALSSLNSLQAPPDANGIVPGRAIVGVDPDPNVATTDVPRGQRTGNFTAGPDADGSSGGKSGSANGSDSAAMASLRVPHLSVTPPTKNPGIADASQPSAVPSPETDREALLQRFRNPNLRPVQALGVTAADTLKENPLPLLGRAVYELSVNMPNVNSYSGSWIIQFAEIKEDNESKGTVMPPSPRTKVDPVYSRAAIDEKIEGDVILHALIRRDGLVDNIEVIKPLDDRLDESAAMALGKWRFNPATKDGVPIDVETVVRIPFRLIPLTDKDRR